MSREYPPDFSGAQSKLNEGTAREELADTLQSIDFDFRGVGVALRDRAAALEMADKIIKAMPTHKDTERLDAFNEPDSYLEDAWRWETHSGWTVRRRCDGKNFTAQTLRAAIDAALENK